MFGDIPNVNAGDTFVSRQDLHNAGIHKGLMRGIAPNGTSIVLSGGYVDDEDLGSEIIYTEDPPIIIKIAPARRFREGIDYLYV